jgi:flagellar biogenesis protein FliO
MAAVLGLWLSAGLAAPATMGDQFIRSGSAAPAASVKNDSRPSGGMEILRVGTALGAVLLLIFGLRWGGRRLFPMADAGRSGAALRVLTRAAISPRQQIMIVQAGRRLLVVGDSGTQLSALCEITDPDEVSELVEQIVQPNRGSSMGSPFKRTLKLTSQPEVDEADDSAVGLAVTRSDVSGLIEKVRTLSTRFRQLGTSAIGSRDDNAT